MKSTLLIALVSIIAGSTSVRVSPSATTGGSTAGSAGSTSIPFSALIDQTATATPSDGVVTVGPNSSTTYKIVVDDPDMFLEGLNLLSVANASAIATGLLSGSLPSGCTLSAITKTSSNGVDTLSITATNSTGTTWAPIGAEYTVLDTWGSPYFGMLCRDSNQPVVSFTINF